MSQKTPVQIFLEQLNAEIEKSTNDKVTKAMRLFMQVDDIYKGIMLHGFRPPLTAPRLRQWFERLDLLDDLDVAIDDMEDEVRASKSREQSQ